MDYNIKKEEQILIQGKGNYCSKLKKRKGKNKNQSNASLTLRKYVEYIYQNQESGHHTQHLCRGK